MRTCSSPCAAEDALAASANARNDDYDEMESLQTQLFDTGKALAEERRKRTDLDQQLAKANSSLQQTECDRDTEASQKVAAQHALLCLRAACEQKDAELKTYKRQSAKALSSLQQESHGIEEENSRLRMELEAAESILQATEADLESEKHAAEANIQKLEELVAGIEATNHRRKLRTLEAESQIRSCLWILGAFAGVCLAACKLTLTALVCCNSLSACLCRLRDARAEDANPRAVQLKQWEARPTQIAGL